jgi:hypothetical protein
MRYGEIIPKEYLSTEVCLGVKTSAIYIFEKGCVYVVPIGGLYAAYRHCE